MLFICYAGSSRTRYAFTLSSNKLDVMRTDFLIVFLGGGIGAALRHGVNLLSTRLFNTSFPAGTFAINLTGALIMGMVIEYALSKGTLSLQMKLLITTGVLGGFTTFSTFSMEIVQLFQRGQAAMAIGYASASLVLGVCAAALGVWLVRQF